MALETVLYILNGLNFAYTIRMKLYLQEVNLWLPLLKSTKNVVTIFGKHFLVVWYKFLNPKSIPCV